MYSCSDPVVSRLSRTTAVSLNELWQRSLKKHKALLQGSGLILRCALLPQVAGDRDQLERLFDQLLSLILEETTRTPRLFLCVDCQQEAGGRREHRFTLRFSTNIIADRQWQEKNRESLKDCAAIVANHGGRFAVHPSAGGLFVLTLNGKPDPCPQ